MLDFSCHLF